MQEPLYPMFSGSPAKTNSEALLQGTLALPSSLDPPTRAFLDQCRYPPSFVPDPLQLTFENHVEFWRKNPENRGLEPHGLHNGHFKAGIQSDMLASCDAAFREIPLSTGFQPEQWLHLMNFAIEKKPGDFRVSKMRTIQMMNSEFQANNKLIGSTSMAFAERHRLIPPGQCGARKHHQAIDLAVSKRLIWDSLLLDREAAGWVSNDAKSCFDRIMHWVGKLALMRFGIPWEAVSMIFDVLALAKHRIRTGFGDSPRVFSPTTSIPFQGCGQGNGAGPAIWVAISAILIDMMDAAGFGYSSRTAISDDEIFAACFSFIDDTDVIETKGLAVTGEELLPSVRQALELWAGGVRATGGAINPEKSYWWLIDFDWSPSGKWSFRRVSQMPGSLSLTGLTGRLESLRRLEPDEPERTLGVVMSPLDNGHAQRDVLRAKAKEWAEALRPSCLMPYDIFPLIRTTIMKTLEYPMPLTTLSSKEWRSIMWPILRRCLPKAGVCHRFKRVVVFAPLKYQGLGLPNPFSLQVYHHVALLMRHSINPSPTGRYLRSVMESHQLETGSSYGLFQQQFDNTGILASETLVKRFWSEFEPLSIRAEFSHQSLALRRVGDQLLTDLFVDELVDQDTLLWLNWCRVFLHASTVSDLVTADGKFLTREAWEGRHSSSFAPDYRWPRSARPSAGHWDSWRAVLSAALLCPPFHLRRLRHPLGPWTDSFQRWRWLFLESSSVVFSRSDTSWWSFRPVGSRACRTFRRSHLWTAPLPADCCRVTVECSSRDDVVVVSLPGESCPEDEDPLAFSILSLWRAWRDDVSGDFGWVPDSLEIVGDEQELWDALLAGELRLISDGSFKRPIGTSSTQLRSRRGTAVLWIRTRCPGRDEDMSAYRAELIGLFSGLLVISWMLAERVQVSSPVRVRVACDGESALARAFDEWPLAANDAHFDVLSSIRALIRPLPVDWRTRHVRGHVDKYKSWQQMTWWERRNLECDLVAQDLADQLAALPFCSAPNPRFFSEPCAIFVADRKISSASLAMVDEVVSVPALREYWHERGRLSPRAFDMVDWSVVEVAMKALPSGIQRWVSKHTTGMCGVGKFQKIWDPGVSDQCPMCDAPEDHLHVPRCPSPAAATQWATCVQDLVRWFTSSMTAPYISDFLLGLLSRIRDPGAPLPPVWYRLSSSDRGLFEQACEQQLVVGSQCLLEGLLVPGWAELQLRHYRSIRRRRSGSKWASDLSRQFILVGHQMWLHRNSVYHSDDNVAALRHRQVLDKSVREEFRLGPQGLPPWLSPMLHPPLLGNVLAYSIADKEDWLQVVSTGRSRVLRPLQSERQVMWRFMTEYYQE